VAFGINETEAAARALYARLARPLASMPDWLRQAAGTPASASSPATPAAPSLPAFLARKLLTPELVAALLDGLLPLYRQALAGERESAPAAAASAPDSDGVPLRGELAGWPLGDLLALIGAAGRTGELVLTHGARRIIAYCESGEILLVTSHDPADHLQRRDDSAAGPDLSTVPGDLRARAEAEQRASGTPIYVTLDEAGALDDALDIAALLHARGVRLLREAHASTPLHYVWRDRKGLPLYALSWGRHISLAEDLQGLGPASVQAGEPTVAQLSLERLRRPSSWAEIDPHLPHPEQCLERSFGFSNKLRALRLTASEQRVLALVDRRVPIRAIAQRSGLPAREVARIAFRLLEIDLVQALPLSALPGPASLGGVPAEPAARPVMVLDLDDEGFCQPLRALLARRSRPVALMDLSHELDLTDAIARERPGLVVLSEAAAAGRLEEIARAVRAAPHLAGTALAAVVDRDSGSSHDALAAAGFDAIWSKPVHYLDLIALLAAEPASAQRLSPSHTQIST
jgi:hypothetical protein